MRSARHILATVAIAAVVVIVDQATKSAITARIVPGQVEQVLGPLSFTLSYNDGVAFGLAGGRGILVILLAMIALMALGAFIATSPARWSTVVIGGLILGGAAGNLIDRVRLGHVTDFILLPGWPAFNLADVAITTGVILLAWWLVKDGGHRQNPETPAEEDSPRPQGSPAREPSEERSGVPS